MLSPANLANGSEARIVWTANLCHLLQELFQTELTILQLLLKGPHLWNPCCASVSDKQANITQPSLLMTALRGVFLYNYILCQGMLGISV